MGSSVREPEEMSTAIGALAYALKERDRYTGEHSEAVRDLVAALGRRLGLDEAQATEAEQVALLHDMGKLAVPDEILDKPGPLTELEWDLMRQIPEIGSRVVRSIPGLAHVADAIHAEHERWDGLGYPRALSGEAIPLSSRIVFVCDAFCAMTADRPYRHARSRVDALREVAKGIGTQFCPHAANALLVELLAT